MAEKTDTRSKICSIAHKVAMELIEDTCGKDAAYDHYLSLLGFEEPEIKELKPPSSKCAEALQNFTAATCEDFRARMRWIACKGIELAESGMTMHEAFKQAWRELKEKCARIGIVV